MTEEKEVKSNAIIEDTDVSDLFVNFNKRFFWGKLKYVEVRWSPRMTLCAGLCVYQRRPGYCSIRLSRPLLSLRGKTDLVETLLHEMIHAYLFVTNNDRDRDGHGPEFLKHMYRINREADLNISVFHTFGDEVRHYQQHIWQCNGPCQLQPPYFGKVCRSMNRIPGPTDYWWEEHSFNCGGSFLKVSEPKGFKPLKKKTVTTVAHESKEQKNGDIRVFFKPTSQTTNDLSEASNKQGCKEIRGAIEATTKTSSSTIITEPEKQVSADLLHAVPDENDDDFKDPLNSGKNKIVSDFFRGILGVPFRYLKRHAEDPDHSTDEVRRPDLDKVPMSKRGKLKNLIKVPDQPTLDAFYKKRKVPIAHSKLGKSRPKPHLSQSMGDTLKQQSVKSFLNSHS